MMKFIALSALILAATAVSCQGPYSKPYLVVDPGQNQPSALGK